MNGIDPNMLWLLKGGVFIWPILLLSIIGLYFLLDRLIHFWVVIPGIKKSVEKIVDGTEAEPVGHFAHALVDSFKVGRLDEDLLRIAIQKDIADSEKFINGLGIISQVSPLLGLLGTVTGMIQVFQRIQEQTGQPNPSMLAGGIWEALITTAVGLTVAIPALVGALYFNNRIARFEFFLHENLTKVMKREKSGGDSS